MAATVLELENGQLVRLGCLNKDAWLVIIN